MHYYAYKAILPHLFSQDMAQDGSGTGWENYFLIQTLLMCYNSK